MFGASIFLEKCPVCQVTVDSRGGKPLHCPGCCGKWFHQNCFDLLVANGQTDCPHCRQRLPSGFSTEISNVSVPSSDFSSTTSIYHFDPATNNSTPYYNCFDLNRQHFSDGSSSWDCINGMQQQQQYLNRRFKESDISDTGSALMREEPTEENSSKDPSYSSFTPEISIAAFPEYEAVGVDHQRCLYTQVSLRYEECATAMANGDKTALDLVCVLDNSGSMGGLKIKSLKNAVEFVIDSLSSNDRLSIVYFNSAPGGLHGLLRMTSENKLTSKRLLKDLCATGGTNIYAGMDYGWSIIERRVTRNPSTCVFLLTDGQDRTNLDKKLELARRIKRSGSSFFVFGFGSDHDADHMKAIADAGETMYTYVESDHMVVDAFGGTIGTQQTHVITDIELSIEACERDVRIIDIQAGHYTSNIDPDGRRSKVSFRNMYMGETREVLLQLYLPVLNDSIGDYALIVPSVTYHLQKNCAITRNGSSCVLQRLHIDQLSSAGSLRNIHVDIHLNRILCTESIAAAVRDADAGNFGAAKLTIAAAKSKLQASTSYQQLFDGQNVEASKKSSANILLALIQELDDALLRVRSRDEYGRGGKAMMLEAVSSNTYQRSTYTKDGRTRKFQTSISSTTQDTAMNSKPSMGWY